MPRIHRVQQGESLISIAAQYGFRASALRDASENATLKRQRTDLNALLPGDELVIPDARTKELPAVAGQVNTFVRHGVPAVFRMRVLNSLGKPRRHQTYRLVVGGQTMRGITNERGALAERVPADATYGDLIIGPDSFQLRLQFGHLDPIETLSGVRGRLRNLGFDCGQEQGEDLGERTKAALRQFQKRHGLPEIGQPTDVTRKAIAEMHDRPSKVT